MLLRVLLAMRRVLCVLQAPARAQHSGHMRTCIDTGMRLPTCNHLRPPAPCARCQPPRHALPSCPQVVGERQGQPRPRAPHQLHPLAPHARQQQEQEQRLRQQQRQRLLQLQQRQQHHPLHHPLHHQPQQPQQPPIPSWSVPPGPPQPSPPKQHKCPVCLEAITEMSTTHCGCVRRGAGQGGVREVAAGPRGVAQRGRVVLCVCTRCLPRHVAVRTAWAGFARQRKPPRCAVLPRPPAGTCSARPASKRPSKLRRSAPSAGQSCRKSRSTGCTWNERDVVSCVRFRSSAAGAHRR